MKNILLPLLFIVSICNAQTKVDSAALKSIDITKGVKPEIWGAKADGKTDCTWALNECSKWCSNQKGNVVISLSDGIYRITNTWVVGNKWADDSLFFNSFSFTGSQAGVDVNAYRYSRFSNLVSIIGTGQTGLYLDFTDTTRLKTGLMYTLQGDGRCASSIGMFTAKISGVGFYAKGYLANGALDRTKTKYNGSKSIGLIMSYNIHVALENATFMGLKYGLVRNNSYFSEIRNIRFDYCDIGYFDWQSHSSHINTMLAGYCNKAFEVRSSQLVLNNIGTSGCPVSLHVGTGSNLFNGAYFESSTTGEAQIIVGDNIGDTYYKPGYSYQVDGTIINMLTVVANRADKTTGTAILMKESAKRLYLNGGSVQSSFKKFTNTNNKIYSSGVLGMTSTSNTVVIN